MVCGELGLHRELANSVLSQFGVIWGPWRAQTWPLDSNGLLTPFYTRTSTPTLLLPSVILIPARKKLLKTGQILGIRNVYTHSVIASEQMNISKSLRKFATFLLQPHRFVHYKVDKFYCIDTLYSRIFSLQIRISDSQVAWERATHGEQNDTKWSSVHKKTRSSFWQYRNTIGFNQGRS